MDTVENDSVRNSIICCELVLKIKQYINILQLESRRLRTLQLECNDLLDQFYSSKNEFEFLVREAIQIKYLGEEDSLKAEEYIKEFSTFFISIWQMGKVKFSEKGKRANYICFDGSLLSEVIYTIQNFEQEVMVYLTYMPYHSECAATLHAINNQLQIDLQEDCFGSADICLRQFVYLQTALPFLRILKSLIHEYLTIPRITNSKQLIDTVVLHIPPMSNIVLKEDMKDLMTFRFVVDLLNGSLLNKDVLDHNTDIRPVVEDDINLKRRLTVQKTVDWIMQQYKSEDVSRTFENIRYSLSPIDIKMKRLCYNQNSMALHSPRLLNHPRPINFMESMDSTHIKNFYCSMAYNGSLSSHKRLSRKAGKTGMKYSDMSASDDDLQPIKVDSLLSPLLTPLI